MEVIAIIFISITIIFLAYVIGIVTYNNGYNDGFIDGMRHND